MSPAQRKESRGKPDRVIKAQSHSGGISNVVRFRNIFEFEFCANGVLDLLFGRSSAPGKQSLYLRGRVMHDRNADIGDRHQNRAAGVGEKQ